MIKRWAKDIQQGLRTESTPVLSKFAKYSPDQELGIMFGSIHRSSGSNQLGPGLNVVER